MPRFMRYSFIVLLRRQTFSDEDSGSSRVRITNKARDPSFRYLGGSFDRAARCCLDNSLRSSGIDGDVRSASISTTGDKFGDEFSTLDISEEFSCFVGFPSMGIVLCESR